jgi:type I restriction-modification system DNA methylase subunit
MTSFQMPLLGPKHLNHGLFSDYYLDEIVPRRPEWLALLDSARSVRDQLRVLRDQIRPAELNEAQLEEQWIRRVLNALGHYFAVQVNIQYRGTGRRTPDYLFTRTADEAHHFTAQIYTPQELKDTLAVGDAKRWGVPLDQSPAPGQRNPSQQIDEYLRYSELPWGILTDGRYWRLYERDTSKNNVYYAVDLIDLLDRDDDEAFLYFYAFFRQQAFSEGWLTNILEGSESYAQRLSDTLEDQVYEALELIAQGFLSYRRNRLTPTPETLQTIYEQSLVLLYRLLFILYAESRDTLPIRENADYANASSLEAIKKELLRITPARLRKDSTAYYSRLNDLFFSIDQGDPELAMPAYNGRLFSVEQFPFLTQKAVGDRYLMQALDRLTRVTGADGRPVFVDYRDLDVRHLGAIYEKLLEYHPDVASEPLTVREGKYVPAQRGEKPIKQAGEVYLRTGSNERKITGSYYTPDYIVRFIVERTLEPLLTEITERYATRDADGHWIVKEPEVLREVILALNILDPATGSGHFMVDATAYIAEWLRGLALNPADLGGEDELAYWKRLVVNSCIYGVDVNPLAVELAKVSLWLATLTRGKPLSFLDHHLKCGNSLVGARVREIGAKLTDPASERRGKAKEVASVSAGQSALFDNESFAPAVSFAVDQMTAIEQTHAENVAQVKRQERLYADLVKRIEPWKTLANLWTARYFGLTLDQNTWQRARDFFTAPDNHSLAQMVTQVAEIPGTFIKYAGIPSELREPLEQTFRLTAEQRFLHWELEFPEIFFNPDGTPRDNPGFDAVIGNPPYVRQERIQPIKPFLATKYRIYQGTADLFLYFYELGLRLLKPNQRLGYITSGTYMNSNSAAEFRRHIHENASFETVFNFGENQPFRGAEMVYPTIAILRGSHQKQPIRNYFVEDSVPFNQLEAAFDRTIEETGSYAAPDVTGMDEWRFQAAELTELFRKITTGYSTVGQTFAGRIYRGITTGLNEAFVIDEQTQHLLLQEHELSAQIIKPMRRGEDLRPWYQIESSKYLILAYKGINIADFPAILGYLQAFKDELSKRWEPAHGECEWYELRPCDYYNEFEKPKIYWAEIAKLPRFSWDSKNLYASNKAHMLIPQSQSTLALLNSRVSWFAISQMAVPLRLRAGLWQYQVTQQFVERLPIPDLTSEQEASLAELAETITSKAQERYQLHEATRRRIAADLGKGGKLNERLEEWWLLADVAALRAEVRKAFKTDVPLAERDEWENFLADRRGKHQQMTAKIVALETRLNEIVYEAFKLTAEEIALIERATKYPYGEP